MTEASYPTGRQPFSYSHMIAVAQRQYERLSDKSKCKLTRGPYYIEGGMLYGAWNDASAGPCYAPLRGAHREPRRPLP